MSVILSDGDCFSFSFGFELEKQYLQEEEFFVLFNPREGFYLVVNFSFTCILLCGTTKVICLNTRTPAGANFISLWPLKEK